MVTVIIPALNEERTIRKVIQIVKKSACVSEIIVVDDRSVDNTVAEAKKERVRIFTSSVKGKGTSMREGIMMASQPVIAFVDADITTYPDDVIDRLATPIINGEADFVKSYFERQAGRVTELVAKPLLSFLFPLLSDFKQPLSGMIAGKAELLRKIDIEDDYGVDIGILIDMHQSGAQIKEVSLGYIENRMQSIAQLGRMSKEVTKAILKRSGQLIESSFDVITDLYTNRPQEPQLEFAARSADKHFQKMAIFDMDKTLLRGSFIYSLAQRHGFLRELKEIVSTAENSFMRIKQIAKLLNGLAFTDILDEAERIPVVDDAIDVIKKLRDNGYICGIISESYDVVSHHIATKLGMDFSLANELEFHKSYATGEVKLPSFFLRDKDALCSHDYCKSNAVLHVIRRYGIRLKNIIAVGNGANDICMIKHAGVGISFCANDKALETEADHRIFTPSFQTMLSYIL